MATGRLDRVAGHPAAFVVTTAILVLIFGWTFFTNAGRPAAADDPAFYTWRTEALLANDPSTLLTMDGPRDMFAAGYRVVTPVLGGLMRQIADVAVLTPTIIMAVGLRVLIPLLLAGFAYRSRSDPLIWHSVALGSASLLLTPPFGGYLDNVMTLLFLSASLYLIAPARLSWGPRIAFFGLLLVSGFTHPTTLAIFCLTLAAMAFFRFVLRGFQLRSVIQDDGPIVVTAFLAAIVTYGLWKVGIWGESASLGEAALPPPAGADFFRTRLNDWLSAMRPVFNGPLFLIGIVGLIAVGRRAAEDELTRVSIAWLLPLVGILGVVTGAAYPYYRFFNTTTAWLLIVGAGAFFVVRYCFDIAKRGGAGAIALVGVLAVGFVIGTNFTAGLDHVKWNDVSDAWIKPDERAQLETVSAGVATNAESVVFVVDDEAKDPVRIYGFVKRAGNVTRYAVPGELQDRTAVYLGTVENFEANKATPRDDYYESLSEDTLRDVRAMIGNSEPEVVLVEAFNRTGQNAGAFGTAAAGSVTLVDDPRANDSSGIDDPLQPSPAFFLVPLLLMLLLLVPGALLLRWALPGAGLVDALGLVPALSAALLALVGIVLLSFGDAPLTSGKAWLIWLVATVLAAVAAVARGLSGTGRLPRESMPAVP